MVSGEDQAEKIETQRINMNDADSSDIYLQIRRICHDLNAPLRAVHGFSDILMQRETAHLSERGQLYLQRIVGATEQMGRVVDGLHQYAQLATHSLQIQSVSIQKLSQKLMASYYQTPLDSGELHWHVEGDLQWLSDSVLLRIIMRALVDNALLFRVTETAPDVSVVWQMDAEQLQFSVQDHGFGIAAEYQQNIFKLFERLHNREQYLGAGVGLALIGKATQILQGSISITAAPEKGTQIQVTLPREPKEVLNKP